ncbi:MAG TPA: tetratricopeptide repeat protein [Polyangiaceae bacterium]|nr:tetratricopeptide repeat protein [Polyangiaceae bacterium]
MTKPPPLRRPRAALLALALGGAAPAALAQSAGAAPPGSSGVPAASGSAPARAPAGPAAPSASSPAHGAALGEELRLRGNAAWAAGRYADALADYEEARKVSQDPKIFYNLAAAYQKLGRNADAYVWLSRFQSSASREDLEPISNLDKRIAALRNKITFLKVTVNVAGARVLVRDAAVGTTRAHEPLEIWSNEGRAEIEIIGEGYRSYRKAHVLQGGGSLELDVQLNRQSAPITVVENVIKPTPFWSQWWFWAGVGVLVTGGAITVYALSTEKSPDDSTLGQLPAPLEPRGLGFRF